MSNQYRTYQQQNTARFNQYTKQQQKELRELGYHNVGYEGVTQSRIILDNYDKSTEDTTEETTQEPKTMQSKSVIVPFKRQHPHGQFKSRFASIIDDLDAAIERDKEDLRIMFHMMHFEFKYTVKHSITPCKLAK